jgi:hypothetical protein
MLLTESAIRQLIYNVLLEGVREDAAALEVDLEDNPEALSQFQSLSAKPKWVNWLADRYLRKKYPVDDTLLDVLSLVVNFASKDAAISQKYGSNEQFKTAVDAAFPPESRGWKSPSDTTKMSSADFETLLALHDRKKQRLEVDRADESWKQDKIGQFGPWALYFPTNQQNSINIAGADPVTLKGYTTWCTARTAGSNLFYNYAGNGIMLFYAIDESKPPTAPKGRICLGYVRGALNASGSYGGVTVDALNKGLKMPDLQKIFGNHLRGILAAAEAVVKHHGAEHPAKTEIKAASRDVVKFKSILSGLSDDEAGDLCAHIVGHTTKTVSLDVLIAAASHKSAGVRACVARNTSTPLHVLEKLAADPEVRVRDAVAYNHWTPPHVLEKLAADPEVRVRASIVYSKAPAHVREKLADDPEASVRVNVAYALNESTPQHLFEKLAADPEVRVRDAVAYNRWTPPHVLEKLASDTDVSIRVRVAYHGKVTPHVLEKLAADTDMSVRDLVAKNLSTPPHVLEKLAANPDAYVRATVAYNLKTPLHVLEKLAADPRKHVREAVARNKSTPPHVLEKLAADRVASVRFLAAQARQQPIGEAQRLAHRIIAELKRR